jgi:hypothetical protein
MLLCHESCVWLILDMSCPLGAVAVRKCGRFQPEPIAKTKVVCSQNTKHTTAGPFHLLHMGPLSDVTMS